MADNATLRELTPRKRRALESLLTSGDVTEAARAANVARQTVHKWLQQPAFAAALAMAEADKLHDLQSALVRLGDKATATLGAAMDSVSPMAEGARVRAADIVLSHLLKMRELVTLEERIAALEAATKDGDK
jgi:phage terminase small subunit